MSLRNASLTACLHKRTTNWHNLHTAAHSSSEEERRFESESRFAQLLNTPAQVATQQHCTAALPTARFPNPYLVHHCTLNPDYGHDIKFRSWYTTDTAQSFAPTPTANKSANFTWPWGAKRIIKTATHCHPRIYKTALSCCFCTTVSAALAPVIVFNCGCSPCFFFFVLLLLLAAVEVAVVASAALELRARQDLWFCHSCHCHCH